MTSESRLQSPPFLQLLLLPAADRAERSGVPSEASFQPTRRMRPSSQRRDLEVSNNGSLMPRRQRPSEHGTEGFFDFRCSQELGNVHILSLTVLGSLLCLCLESSHLRFGRNGSQTPLSSLAVSCALCTHRTFCIHLFGAVADLKRPKAARQIAGTAPTCKS